MLDLLSIIIIAIALGVALAIVIFTIQSLFQTKKKQKDKSIIRYPRNVLEVV